MAIRPLDTSHLAPVWSRAVAETLIVERGEGAYLYTVDGRKLLDFTCGIGVTNTGHAHPKVVKAIQEQAAKIIHSQANISYHLPMLQLVEELLPLVPPQLSSFYFSNSGAEITEGAVKLAKQATGRPNIIVSREQLLDQVWGWDDPTGMRTVDVRIAEIRRKLGPELADLIETVPGEGYRFVGTVKAG
ncbi:MAG: aminotransferase class III-fold pyridoxal phosphate-dependent enzyme [Anaerolineales bacterium]|nr:aminotransferase class III-fold pyridoxal phosphate-dependent enzyme [Anaerolineales bacterium]